MTRISLGKVELRKGLVDLATVVPRAVEEVQQTIEARGHALAVSLPPAPVYVEGDLSRLEQVIANLVHNAAKYTDPCGRIEVALQREGEEAILRVRDTGIGISPELLPRIFDLFVQADRSPARERGGLGIGLSVVRQLVELHGGRVAAHSAGPGQGSAFVVCLPLLSEAQVQKTPVAQGKKGPPTTNAPARRVLVVDDNVDAAHTLAIVLRRFGDEVQVAHNGPAALEVAAAFRPAVVLLDLGLPGMDGYEVARHLRTQPGLTQVTLAALTGYGQEEDRHRTQEAGFDAHFVKPVDLGTLQELLVSLG